MKLCVFVLVEINFSTTKLSETNALKNNTKYAINNALQSCYA